MARCGKAGSLFDEISKRVGKSLVCPGKSLSVPSSEIVPTGILEMDYGILSIGGFVRGTLVELAGPESSGKSYLAMLCTANAQRLWPDKQCAWCDAEGRLATSYGVNWMRRQGVDYNKLILIGNYGQDAENITDGYSVAEEVFDAVTLMARSGEFSVIVVDSLAALIPKVVIDSQEKASKLVGEQWKIGALASVCSRAFGQLSAAAAMGNCLIVFTNQIRSTLASVERPRKVMDIIRRWDDDETTVGGRAFKFYASQRVYLTHVDDLHVGGDKKKSTVGTVVAAKLVKSTVSPPRTMTGVDTPDHMRIRFDGIIDTNPATILQTAVRLGLVEQAGSYYTWNDVFKVQGRGAFNVWWNAAEEGTRESLLRAIRDKASGVAPEEAAIEDKENL